LEKRINIHSVIDTAPGVTATLDFPAADGTSGVFIDGKSVQAKKVGHRWNVTETVSGKVTAEVK
jgi:alpha-L-rhamnosidase